MAEALGLALLLTNASAEYFEGSTSQIWRSISLSKELYTAKVINAVAHNHEIRRQACSKIWEVSRGSLRWNAITHIIEAGCVGQVSNSKTISKAGKH